METVFRALFVYVFILVGLRIMGKREFSQLSPLELVILLLIPEIFSQSILREDFSLINAVIATSTLFSVVYLSSLLRFFSERFSDVVEGQPAVLVHHGKLVQPKLNIERVTPGEVFAEMHKVGLHRLEQVKWAILETDGKIAIIPEESPQDKPGTLKNDEDRSAL